ncbi:thioredoxin TrxC [Mariluticola halotolerans]|uniref:thioredoxin TrxC n=1 Tax=Mariluticola halotolerans TaxID=2909283 RepID=UPI0026E20BE4|nr:thioredoxin TrxC [Mariluticola halotolerans]UJQ93153.1 thioredoxin TrxC [Mariluticola halotolerans]
MTKNHIVCAQCGQINQVAPDKPAREAKCGACKQPLFAGKPSDVDARNFERQIAKSDIPVLVDVWAPWCGPCRAMAPAYEQAARQLEPAVRVIKLNSDREQQISARLGIRGIPTMLLMQHGREIGRISGAMAASDIVAWTQQQLAK